MVVPSALLLRVHSLELFRIRVLQPPVRALASTEVDSAARVRAVIRAIVMDFMFFEGKFAEKRRCPGGSTFVFSLYVYYNIIRIYVQVFILTNLSNFTYITLCSFRAL